MIKLLFDYLLVILFFPIFLTLYLFGVIVVFFSDGLPIHYISYRVGLQNKDFRFYKLRTMKNLGDDKSDHITDSNDVRIFKGGNLLRKLKIDEIPQLINVLNRSMSIIGPRPEIRELVNKYNSKQLETLNMLPGLACLGSLYYYLFQIDEGNKNYETEQLPLKLSLDLYYINKFKQFGIFYDVFIIIVVLFFILIKSLKINPKPLADRFFYKMIQNA